MEENYTLNVLNSAPESECEDSEEIVVLNPSPVKPSQDSSDFSLNNINFSPVCVSAVSSQTFIELLTSSRKAVRLASKKKAKKVKKNTSNLALEAGSCKSCEINIGKELLSYSSFYCDSCFSELRALEKHCEGVIESGFSENSGSLIIENASISKKYSKAMWMLSIIDMLSDSEIEEQQKLLLNLNSTLVVKVKVASSEFAWEVPCEFTIKDLKDLVESTSKIKGEVRCNEILLDSRLMLGFVRTFIWRKTDILSVDLYGVDEID